MVGKVINVSQIILSIRNIVARGLACCTGMEICWLRLWFNSISWSEKNLHVKRKTTRLFYLYFADPRWRR
jgi:hypothetical protein